MTHRYAALLVTLFLVSFSTTSRAQDDAMMQGFYWDVPVDANNLNGSWWDTLAVKARELSEAGITGIWTPSPAKGNFGIYDMGYGIFDHYDLGNYNQKGTVETRFGSRGELFAMVDSLHTYGVEVYADIILNHIYTGDTEEEANPAVKEYVFDEAVRDPDGDGTYSQFSPYPTNEIRWRIPGAGSGDYYIKIKGYHLNCDADYKTRAYDLYINWDDSPDQPNEPGSANWESEPNDGNGQFNTYPGSGQHVWAHMNTCSDNDEYKITLSSSHDIEIRLEARKEETDSNGNAVLNWADQTNGYYPFEIWHNGQNLAASALEARTNTGISYVAHTDAPNYTWDYNHFHPVDDRDYLGYPGTDEIIPNTKFFGNDLNTFDTTVQDRLKDWGVWLTNTVGYDGYRLDFVRGFQESFAADWIKAMPTRSDGSQRFVVGEYWGSAARIEDWVNTLASMGADADGFDFPLKSSLTDMANGSGSSFDMRWLNHAGLVRNNDGHSLPGTSVVTFVDNHDTGKEHDKWVTKDWDMAYAYILFAEGRPCIFYPHFYGVEQVDAHDPSYTVQAPLSLQQDIRKLLFVRRTYLGGTMEVLSQVGNPYPSGDAYNVYVARRQGNGTKSGAILVLNNHDTDTKGLWVDNTPGSGFADWAGKTLINVIDGTSTSQVYSDGRVYVWAPSRSYTVWVPQDEYVAYTASKSGRFEAPDRETVELCRTFSVAQNYPNPFNPSTRIAFEIPEAGPVRVIVYDVLGRRITTLVDDNLDAGRHEVRFDAATDLPSGLYYYTVSWKGRNETRPMLLVK